MTESIVKVHMQCYVPLSVAWKGVELVVVSVVRWDMLCLLVTHWVVQMDIWMAVCLDAIEAALLDSSTASLSGR